MSQEVPQNIFFQTDSRWVKEGDLFVALPGARVDGHNFLEQASMAGASHAIVNSSYVGPSYEMKLIFADDPLQFLQKLAREKIQKLRPKIIAVTGSVGKTSTKEFLAALLSKKFAVAKSIGNQNSQVGLPITLLNDWQAEPLLVLEMGMSAIGNIASLVSIAPPDIALITEIAPVHIEYLGSLEQIVQAKGEILEHPQTRFGLIKKGVFGNETLKQRGLCQKIFWQRDDRRYPAPKLPSHLIDNFHLACLVAELLGVSKASMQEVAEKPPLISRRFEILQKSGITFVNDGYNACELSMIGALENMPEARRRVAVLGEIMELGAYSKETHARIGEKALRSIDHLFLVGEGTAPIEEAWNRSGKEVYRFATTEALRTALEKFLSPGDAVLLKGSRKWQLYEIAEGWPA